MTSGWSCPRCSNVMAPFIVSCPFCAKTAVSAVPGFKPGDRVWPKADGPMAHQQAPQTVMAGWRDAFSGGDWLWLDAGSGSFGSWAAEWWTTEEPDDREKAAIGARKARLAEENERMAARRSHAFTFGGVLLPPPGADTLPGPFAMTPGAEYRFTVVGDWVEILPDLQCRLDRAIYTCGSAEPAAVDLEFRRTPQAGVNAEAMIAELREP